VSESAPDAAPESDPVAARRRWKRAIQGSYLGGSAAIFGGVALGYDLAGAVLYLLGVVLGTALWAIARFRSPVLLYDERDRRLERRASYWAFMIAAGAGLAGFPPLFVLEAAGYYVIEPPLEGVLYAFSALFLLWGACYGVVRSRA